MTGRMLYAETEALPGRWRGTGWVCGGIRDPRRERRLLSFPPLLLVVWLYRGGHYCGTIVYGLFPSDGENGTSEWGGNDGNRRKRSRQRDKRWKSERHRERHRDAETTQPKETRDSKK